MSTRDEAPPLTKDDPIPAEVHQHAVALAKAVLRLPPKLQRELVKERTAK